MAGFRYVTARGEVGRTSRSDGGNDAMGHAIPSSLYGIRPNILHSTKDHRILHNIRRSTKGRRIHRSTMGRSSCNISTDCRSSCSSTGCNMSCKMDCNVCSSTMMILNYMGRTSSHICFQGPISSHKGFHRQSRPCRRPSGRTVSLRRSFPESLWCPSCHRTDISGTPLSCL